MRAAESGSPEKLPGKGAFYYINHHISGTILGLSNEVSFVPEILWKDGENKGNIFSLYWGYNIDIA